MKKLIALSTILLAVMVLLTCKNGINFIEEIETEVSIAHNKFLIINSSTPAQNAKEINPSITIELELDRAVNLNTANTNSILITDGSNPYEEFTATYNASTKILSITPTDFLDASTEYTVTVNENLKGTDGSVLLDNYFFAFTTGDLPAGDVWINDSIGDRVKFHIEPEITADSTITLFMDYNEFTDEFRYGESEAGPFSAWIPITTSTDISLSSGDGFYEIWVEFGDGTNISEARSDGVIIDETPGTVNISSSFPSPILAASNNVLSLAASTSAAESGIQSYAWSATPDGGGNGSASFGNSAQEDTTVTVAGQDSSDYGATPIDLTLRATDRLGRNFSDSIIVHVDTVSPGAPTVSGTSPTLDPSPEWSWSSGGGGISGSPAYQYQLGSTTGTWTDSISTSRTWSTLPTGIYTLYVREQDISGNWSSPGSKQIQIVAPPVSGPSYTLDRTPTWTWSSNADGTGEFRFYTPGGAWTNLDTTTSYTPSSDLSDTTHTLEVQEWNGSTWSNSGSKTIRVTPVIPYNGQTTVGYKLGVTLQWRERETGRNDSYTIQAQSSRGVFQDIVSGFTGENYTVTGLSASTTYVWRIIVHPYLGEDYYYEDASKGFSFTTSRF